MLLARSPAFAVSRTLRPFPRRYGRRWGSSAFSSEPVPPSMIARVSETSCYHDGMAKNLTLRLDDQLAADAEAIARAEGTSLNETVKQALKEAVERRRKDPEFKARLRRIIEEDRELLERLAK